MLTIRKEQMGVFETLFLERFRKTLRLHLREEFAEETTKMTDGELDKLIQLASDRARTYNVTTECDVTLFADLMFLKSRDFDRDPALPWVRTMLLDRELDGATKMQAIYRRFAAFENRKSMPEELQ